MLNPERNGLPARLTLKARVLNAGGWLFIMYGLNLTIRIGSNLLMTRLLLPEMFGVISMANIVLVGLAMFSDLGLKQCIVRSERGHDPAFLNTVWVVQILQGALLWLIALGISFLVWFADLIRAIPVDSAYSDPILPYVIGFLSSAVVIHGFASTKYHEASRTLRLGRVAQVEIISQIVGLLCMLAWVSIDRSIWALVAGGISSSIARTCLSHVWLPGPSNGWHWDSAAFREIVRFGKWMFLSSNLGFLVNNGDRLLLGGMVDSKLLGIYAIASLMFSAIEQVFGTVISEITFPALSEIARERRAELKTSYYRLQIIIASLTYASAGVLMGAGQAVITALYDPRYAQAGWMLRLLAVALLAVPWRSAILCFLALGMPKVFSIVLAIRMVTLFAAVPVGFHLFGLPGALGGIVLSHFSYLPAVIFYSAKSGLLDIRKELMMLPVAALGFAVGKLVEMAMGY
jgi:O-antigen/teichoic acid export membrane protein